MPCASCGYPPWKIERSDLGQDPDTPILVRGWTGRGTRAHGVSCAMVQECTESQVGRSLHMYQWHRWHQMQTGWPRHIFQPHLLQHQSCQGPLLKQLQCLRLKQSQQRILQVGCRLSGTLQPELSACPHL